MALYQAVVPARYTEPLLRLLRAQEGAVARTLLAEIGLDEACLDDPDHLIDFAKFDALFNGLVTLTGRHDLGFEVGLALDTSTHGVLGLAFSRCKTVGDLLGLISRYSRLMTPSFTLTYRRQRDGGELLWRPTAGMSPTVLHACYEIHVVSLHRALGELLGERLLPYSVTLPIERPDHASRYRTLKRLEVQFVPQPLPATHTRFSAALLDLSLNPPTRLVEPPEPETLTALNHRFAQSQSWSDWLRLMLREANGVQPSQVELAGLLNVSAHTLARRLAQEGQQFRQIAVTTRHERASHWLRHTQLSLTEIAQRLGYGETSNFVHAFRRIEGLSPTRYRVQWTAEMRSG